MDLTKLVFIKKIKIKKFNLNNKNISEIENSSIILFTGEVRTAEKIESNKFKKLTDKKIGLLDQIVKISENANLLIKSKNCRVQEIGELLDDTWQLKRSIHKNVSNKKIDEIYQYSKEIGAYGGKILGAGGGGFLYLLCPKNKKENIKKKLNKFSVIDVKISKEGSKIISSTPEYK